VGDKFRVGATTQETTGISVQRLFDMRDKDVIKEGVTGRWLVPIDNFVSYWNTIYGKKGHGWDKNDWVWVIGFKTVGENG